MKEEVAIGDVVKIAGWISPTSPKFQGEYALVICVSERPDVEDVEDVDLGSITVLINDECLLLFDGEFELIFKCKQDMHFDFE